ncbi:MAG: dTDP-4-dehydrorhamnose reductase [Lachnospiraceae bacterium]|nr:dTDP-4-dehydrorhamnose reductase [Lachnospiraceae bacterium]
MAKKLLITGSNGQLGRALSRLYEKESAFELINTDFGVEGVQDLDITDLDSVLKCVREIRPYAVINCAALTNVDGCEKQRDAAFKLNALGPRNLSIAATECGARLVHISTDYVFPGTSETPLTEFDPTGPKSVYGSTKLAGEEFVKQFANRYYMIRTAWLYGDGKNFVKTMLRLSEDHDKITVVNDQIGSPTSAAELARAIAYLLETDQFGLYHGTCEGSCSWADFAAEIFRCKGKQTEVVPVTSAAYKEMNPASADRPAFSVLDNYMFRLTGGYAFSHWHDAMETYLREI